MNQWGDGPIAKFLSLYNQWEQKSGFADKIFVDFEQRGPAAVYIDMVQVMDVADRQQGLGTKIMDAICTYADQTGVTLTLVPTAQDEDTIPYLSQWYMGFGFEGYSGGLIRKPKVTEKIEQPHVNRLYPGEEPKMSLRAIIAESETEYRYRIYSTAPIHGGAELAAIRVGLAGRMAREIKPAGILPWMGTKSDRFPEVAMKPVHVVELVTGLPLSIPYAIRELSFALNVAEDKIQVDGEHVEAEPEVKPAGKPYAKDGITPTFLGKDMTAETPMQSLKDLLGDLGKDQKHQPTEVKPVFENFSVTHIEAEAMLNTDLRKGYYFVRQLSEGNAGISGPHPEVAINFPLDLDRIVNVPLVNEMNYAKATLTTIRVQDTDTGKEYPVAIEVSPGMDEEQIRNAAVNQVAMKFAIPTEQLIAMDPNRPMPTPAQTPGQVARAAVLG